MKLLELLVQDKVQWPDGALWAVQDRGKGIKFTETPKPPAELEVGVWIRYGIMSFSSVSASVLADDWATKAVSKAEYDAAVAEAPDGRPYYVPMRMWYAELSHVIAAAAEGKIVQYLAADGNWYDGSGAFIHPNAYRIKPEEPKTIKVNGFDVPEPMRELIPVGTPFYLADATVSKYYSEFYWTAAESDTTWLARGLLHDTVEAAVAHAKAMLGIDPYATEDADDEHA